MDLCDETQFEIQKKRSFGRNLEYTYWYDRDLEQELSRY